MIKISLLSAFPSQVGTCSQFTLPFLSWLGTLVGLHLLQTLAKRSTPSEPDPDKIQIIYDRDVKKKYSKIKGFILPDFVNQRCYDDIQEFKVHDQDIFVVSFPKSGWCMNIHMF